MVNEALSVVYGDQVAARDTEDEARCRLDPGTVHRRRV
jgi:hypothetical protein